MTLEEQRDTIERALGERMLNHVYFFLRQWAKELGFGPYSDRIHSLSDNYNHLFDYYLATDDPERNEIHNKLTSETYRLMDEMYADIRLKRGLAPQMVGFNADNPESVMRYFSNCVHLQEEDLDWICEAADDPERSATALIAFAALCSNLRESFQEDAVLTLIDLMDAESEMISEQATVHTILTLAQWDMRLDFFENIENAFLEKLNKKGDMVYMALGAVIKSVHTNLHEMIENHELVEEDMPRELREIIEDTSKNEEESFMDKLDRVAKWLPKTETEFMELIVSILPETWVFDTIIGENDDRMMQIEELYLHIGYMDLMWDRWEDAEEWLLGRLRANKATAKDYINYGHCCFLRGDRMMAYENYCEAKKMCESTKAFFDLFRPDRKMLVEKGIPLEQVYLMEDQILR